jgi:hypothetical protein
MTQREPESIPLNTRILLLASAADDGLLDQPVSSGEDQVIHHFFRSSSDMQAIGLAYFETSAWALPAETDIKWRVYGALADAIAGTSDRNITRIARYIEGFSPPGVTSFQEAVGHPSDRFADLFEGAVANELPYHQALIYYALNWHHYWGMSDKYFDAIAGSVANPNAFPKGVPGPSYWENRSIEGAWLKDFQHKPVDVQKWKHAILSSQNPRVTSFLILNLPSLPGNELDGVIAKMLDDPDLGVRWRISSNLAVWKNDAAHAPPSAKSQQLVEHPPVTIYPNLEAIVLYWKHYLAGNQVVSSFLSLPSFGNRGP